MIINIRGTSGSGKSTLVKSVTSLYDSFTSNFEEGRKQPISTLHHRKNGRPLLVPGHYNTACGGCDTVKTIDQVYDLVKDAAASGYDVLFEGIMVGDDVRRAIETSKIYDFRVVLITTPIDVCLDSVTNRRRERGDDRPLNPKKTVERAKRCTRYTGKLQDAGVATKSLDRDGTFYAVCEMLGLAKQ